MAVTEVQPSIEKTWRPNPGKQSLFISLPDSIFEGFYGGAAGGGKDLKISSLILTPNGFVPLEHIHSNNYVIDSCGLPNQVIAESEIFENHPCYELEFDNGTKIIAGEDHLWPVLSYTERARNFKLTPEFREQRRLKRKSEAAERRTKNLLRNPNEIRGRNNREDLVLRNSFREYKYLPQFPPQIRSTKDIVKALEYKGRCNYTTNLTLPIFYPHKELLIHPYLLGVWLGDGFSKDGYICCWDLEILDKIKSFGYIILRMSQDHTYGIPGFSLTLRRLGLLDDKHIPWDYMTASYDQRIELLRGLIDTDGYVAEDGQTEIALSNPELANQVNVLITSLGIKTFKTINEASYKDKQGQKVECKDRIRIKFTTNLPIASLPRKVNRLPKEIDERLKVHYIKNAKAIGHVPTKCISLAREPHQYLVSESLIPTHNSEALLMLPLLRQWTDAPKFQALILRRIYKELEQSLIERSRAGGILKDGTQLPSFRDFGATYNEQHKRWRFPSGATITFGHAEEEADVRKYDTAEFQYVAFDELTSFTEFQYSFIAFSRCRSTIPGVPALVRSASNPGNVGHGWVRKRFVEPCPTGGKIIAQRIGDQVIKRIFIQAFLFDNPTLTENDPLYRTRLEMLPEAEKRAKLYGDWWTFTGQVFDEWRVEPFIDEPPNARHVIPVSSIPSYLPRVLSIDWGYKAYTYALWGAAFPNKTGIAYREYAAKGQSVKTWTTNIANICLAEGILPNLIVLDPSAWQHREDLTIADQFSAAWLEVTGQRPRLEKASNNRLAGKHLIHDYLRWKTRPKMVIDPNEKYDSEKASWILRNKGMQAYKSYLAMFDPQTDTVSEPLPKLQITSNCELLIKTIPLCVYDDKTNNTEDVREFDGDDPYDNLRYFLYGLERLYSLALSNETFEGKKLEAVRAFESTQDMNALYQKMRYLESKNKVQRPIVRLGRSARMR